MESINILTLGVGNGKYIDVIENDLTTRKTLVLDTAFKINNRTEYIEVKRMINHKNLKILLTRIYYLY